VSLCWEDWQKSIFDSLNKNLLSASIVNLVSLKQCHDNAVLNIAVIFTQVDQREAEMAKEK